MSPNKTYAGGCFTLLSAVIASLAAVYVILVDCVTAPSDCPTNDERRLLLVGILAIAIALNVLIWWALARRPKE
jgi:hypothetical protein